MRFLKYVSVVVALLTLASAAAVAHLLTRGDAAEVVEDSQPAPVRQDVVSSHDLILPVYEPEFVPYAQSNLDPADVVIALSIDGDSRAYPVRILNHREMVNDVVGGVPVVVSW